MRVSACSGGCGLVGVGIARQEARVSLLRLHDDGGGDGMLS